MKESILRTDIRIEPTQWEARMLFSVVSSRRCEGGKTFTDFATVSGRENLGQAIMMRLLTPMGEIAALGHPSYGSRLFTLVGMRNTETNRNLAKLYILESLQMEPRVRKIVDVKVAPHDYSRESVVVSIAVLPIDEEEVQVLEPFTLEFSQ